MEERTNKILITIAATLAAFLYNISVNAWCFAEIWNTLMANTCSFELTRRSAIGIIFMISMINYMVGKPEDVEESLQTILYKLLILPFGVIFSKIYALFM